LSFANPPYALRRTKHVMSYARLRIYSCRTCMKIERGPPMIRLLPIACLFLLLASPRALAEGCQYAGLAYSVGATVCECPSISAQGGVLTGGAPATVTSRRMECKTTGWAPSGTLCVDLKYGGSGSAPDDFYKLNRQYCPSLTSESEVQRFALTAPTPSILVAVRGICQRFKLAATCEALVTALEAVSK